MRPIVYPFGIPSGLFLQSYPKYLPTAYDEGMSLIQKVNKVIKHLDEVGEMSNDIVDNWNQVMEWVLSEGLKDAMKYQTDLWINDGTIDSLLNSHTYTDLVSKNNSNEALILELKTALESTNKRIEHLESLHVGEVF